MDLQQKVGHVALADTTVERAAGLAEAIPADGGRVVRR
jgi:hypothetical protein